MLDYGPDINVPEQKTNLSRKNDGADSQSKLMFGWSIVSTLESSFSHLYQFGRLRLAKISVCSNSTTYLRQFRL